MRAPRAEHSDGPNHNFPSGCAGKRRLWGGCLSARAKPLGTLPTREVWNENGRMQNKPWNANIHYDALLASLASAGDRVLDVGCGDGFLSSRLAELGCQVVALDADAEVLERAKQRWPGHRIDWVHDDVLKVDLPLNSFDVVLSNAALHHIPDTVQALTRMAALARPGGRPGVVGFARNGFWDWPMSIMGTALLLVISQMRGRWEHSAPIKWPPALTYGETKRVAKDTLPGCTFRRLWLGRFFLTWTKTCARL